MKSKEENKGKSTYEDIDRKRRWKVEVEVDNERRKWVGSMYSKGTAEQ